jgi:hypothetical protein
MDSGAVCRRSCEERFRVEAVVSGYEDVYRAAMVDRAAA